MLPLVDLPGIEQQVQSLVVPNQTEKERIAFRRIQFEADAGLRTINDDTEIFEKRMRREKRRNLRISAQFAVHLLGHIDKAVHRPQEIAVERLVSHMAFMRFDVVDLTKDTRRTVLFGKTGNRTETGRHKGGPVFHQHEIRLLAGDPPPHGDPVERIHRIHAPHDVQIGRRRCLHRLIPAGKEIRGYWSVKVLIFTSSPRCWKTRAMLCIITAKPPRYGWAGPTIEIFIPRTFIYN